ncbi:hypothetical protein [Hymenobacter psoromatis]|uniref:hypothetical protein n=1 Tax=Hymenobacter psoromatis TaxID=1484116 RepID=UPI001CBC6C0F|nr:hypothetical protein [Hymenobacter psoromatis]
MESPTPPKGSLEDLFRHHLLESEAAAVPPRPHVWEQLDNSLLLAQNEQYRRRLRAHRWAIAASLLLASLAGGGWLHSQLAPAPTLATATPAAADRPGLATARRAGAALAPPQLSPVSITNRSDATLATTTPPAIDQTSTLASVALPPATHPGAAVAQVATPTSRVRAGRRHLGRFAPGTLLASPDGAIVSGEATGRAYLTGNVAIAPPATTAEAVSGSLPLPVAVALAATGTPMGAEDGPAGAAGLLATHEAGLALPVAALPASLDPVPVTMPPVELARHWQFGLGYAVSAFQPNINFTKATASYGSFVTTNAVAIARPTTVEYRESLHQGLGQRLSLWATRRLGASRWGLRTALELSQNTASSAGAAIYDDGPVATLAYMQALPPQAQAQRTTYRYRAASVSAEARYTNPVKSGFSLYGRMGALLTTLFSAHSEVEGVPEATRTYTLLSTSSPYRHLTAGLRGGGGIQYRPAGHQWALNLGPVAEVGILSMSADPGQDFWHQPRPYSFGLEAGLELGRSPKAP